ncbi:hypothetical protein PHABIO_376 [Pseudomonas phage Phabio]|uniref:Uncharacterized protein n=1 Tax=Pseudomonas phage Phabio TaxID=2006668 RepID=A0A1Y0T2C3_9CAUD|nr:hypothetical protein MZD05_gp376 [Pseudomonas phage Phabio]ARV77007.1 hypothetical protein PHABIO_376 [Pseudomonas phage Phabio]
MPSVSKDQARFMQAAAHNPEFAKKAGIKQSTAKEWNDKDSKDRTKTLPKKVSSEARSSIGVGQFKDQ